MVYSLVGVKGGKTIGIGRGGKPSYKRKKKRKLNDTNTTKTTKKTNYKKKKKAEKDKKAKNYIIKDGIKYIKFF